MMSPFWSLLVALGTWAEAHQALVLACSGTVVVVMGLAQLAQWRARR